MNIYGIKGKVIKGRVLQSLECANCGNKLHRSFGVLRYFHLCGRLWAATGAAKGLR